MEHNNQVAHKKLIIGLGNPDPELLNTYHNVGMLAMKFLAKHASLNAHGDGTLPHFKEHNNSFAYAKIGGVTFVRPLTYMNDSGRAVQDAMHFFDLTPNDILIIHDESDLNVGEVKYATDGGSAGHNGIKSIIDHLGTQEFARVRIGIRDENEVTRKKALEFVLSPIKKKDHAEFEELFKAIANALLEG